jgi:hypothetical protein
MDRFWVGMQAVLCCVITIIAVLCTGHRSGFPVFVVLLVGLAIWSTCLWWFVARSEPGDRKVWHTELRQGLAQGIVGFAVPLVPAVIAWLSPSLQGWLFSTTAAAFGATTLTIMLVALLASSMLDRFVILPRVLGLTRPDPIWRPSTALDDRSRRRVAQGWVAHRGICELFVFTAMAVVLAIALVAVINDVSHDDTLPAALESLGGAGIAVYIFGISGPRHAQAIMFCLAGPVALGSWVNGVNEFGNAVEGFVVDVSVEPGVKLIDVHGDRVIVPLRLAPRLNPTGRPAIVNATWCREQVLEHLLKLDVQERAIWAGPPA